MDGTIVTLTMDPALDISGDVDALTPDSHLACDAVRADAGGGGLNVSRAIRALGGQSTAYYVSGGYTGLQLRYLLDQEGLDHRAIPIRREIRHAVAIRDVSNANQYRFSLSRLHLSEAEWRQCLGTMSGLDPVPDYLVLSSSLPEGVPNAFYAEIIAALKPYPTKIILDVPEWAILEPAYRQGVYLVKPAADELEAMAGRSLTSRQEQIAFAREMVDCCGIEVVLLSLGEEGVCIVTEKGEIEIDSPTVDVVSTVGAGDTLVGATVLGLARGLELTDAVRFGVAAGASTVQTPGSGLCNREETERLYMQLHQHAHI